MRWATEGREGKEMHARASGTRSTLRRSGLGNSRASPGGKAGLQSNCAQEERLVSNPSEPRREGWGPIQLSPGRKKAGLQSN